jgi:hypothetical protein
MRKRRGRDKERRLSRPALNPRKIDRSGKSVKRS